MDSIDVDALGRQVLDRFLAAWPERDLPVEAIAASLAVRLAVEDGEPMLYVSLVGRTVGFGFDGSGSGATEAAVGIAENLAYDAEGDRWIRGGAWREYRPE